MDKQKDFDKDINVRSKMIEEMTELMGNWALRNNMCWHEGHAKALAETFVENDYGKIHENAVVLTRERYSELKGRAEEVFNEMTERMKAEVKIERKMGNRKVEQARKETAEKFAERLKASKTIKAIFGEGWIFSYVEVCKEIDEIAKEFTEGEKCQE